MDDSGPTQFDPTAVYVRSCGCDHPYPLCNCFEGISGDELLVRSKWFSELAGSLHHPPTNGDHRLVMAHFGPAPKPIPHDDLPITLATLEIPLAGDLVASIAKRIGADRLAALWERWTGTPCGCESRHAKLNAATERLVRWAERYRGA